MTIAKPDLPEEQAGTKSLHLGLLLLNLVDGLAIRATIAWNVRELYRSGQMDQFGN